MEDEDQGLGQWIKERGWNLSFGGLGRGNVPGFGIPVWMPHLQKRLLSEKPVAPTICPITCTSAMALRGKNIITAL